jgi:NADPH-dependent ferric siderophore reductase
MYQPEHATHTEATAHHDDRVQYLVVGDESSLGQLEVELSALPLCARGRVFVEVDSRDGLPALAAPMRMTVTWLSRVTPAGRAGSSTAPTHGEMLLRAVRAWTAEMLCDGPGATHAILTGDYASVSAVFDHLVSDIRMSPESIATSAGV